MCGIAGILRSDAGAADGRRVAAMRAAQVHRGPDDEGTWVSPSMHATLGANRLAILDLTSAGHQPMTSPDGRYTVVFNGAIYNFRELRQELGGDWRSTGDTEVLLAAYQRYGGACIDRLRGMFAFAIWDEQERSCFLARDRFGIKPLYYAGDGRDLVFASELRAVVASGLVPRELDPEGLFGYFRGGSVPEPRTLLRKVRMLEAGQVATWRDGNLTARRYWDFNFSDSEQTSAGLSIADALMDSVRHHSVSDVPVGMLLSGGIDSTALLSTAHRAGIGGLQTFTLSMPDSGADETARARRTAQHFGVDHFECVVDAAGARQLLPAYLRALDQPSIDGLNTFAVSQFARGHGIKVLLSGIGADELFGGYKSFRDVPRLAALQRLASPGGIGRVAGRVLAGAPDPRHRRMADLFNQPSGLGPAYSTYRGIFSRAEARTLVAHYSGVAGVMPRDFELAAADPTEQDAVSRLELSRYVRNQLLRDTDTMSMAAGVEVRVPFLDPVMVDAVSAMPARQRLAAGKRGLVEAVPNMPDGIIHRPKRVFQFPFNDWIDGEWRGVFAGLESSCPVPTGSWYRKWCVMALDHWIGGIANEV
jgi:asparagine synthase (glutamine-hydrolysing)